MKRMSGFVPTSILLSIALAACAPPAEQVAHAAAAEPAKNALLIQADFAGLVMTGVAYSVSKDLVGVPQARAVTASLLSDAGAFRVGLPQGRNLAKKRS